ncbi:ParA family protein [Tsukamurella hominis]|uniref:ParA family protein n=1 Tax=Tsukamurella hominis TaxID=1970232 RepID=UPI0039E8DFB4
MNLAAVENDVLTEGGNLEDSPVLVASIDPQGSTVWWAARAEQQESLPFHATMIRNPLDLRKLRDMEQFDRIFIDSPGWIGAKPGSEPSDAAGQAIEEALAITDLAIVPITTEPLSFDPTARTIEQVLEPRGIPYRVVINNWDPRDGRGDLDRTIEFIDAHGWSRANTVIRHYKVHARAAAAGLVVTEYPPNRASFHAREDFQKLMLEMEVA